MDSAFDLVSSVSTGRETWRLKVRVLRLWRVFSFVNATQVNSLEMVLIDEKGVKIHASVRRQLLYLFQSKIIEGNVYKMSCFSVVPENGVYRTTPHPYKLLFQMKTKVQGCISNVIDVRGFSLSTIAHICGQECDQDFLVDVIGVITGISAEREYIRDGKVTKMIIIELTDNSGKVECALFGDYVDDIQKKLAINAGEVPVAVVQFAKIKIFRGKLSIQNVLNATRIYVDPSMQEIVSFKESLAIEGVNSSLDIPVIGARGRPSDEEDFILNFPRTTLENLVQVGEDGVYIVSAIIAGLAEGEEWWYPSCRCHRSVSADSGAYYCKICVKHVFKMVPRYRVKMNVESGDARAVFVMFDSDVHALLGKSCHELVAAYKEQNGVEYPPEIKSLLGMKLLFKVEKTVSLPYQDEISYRVKRICNDVAIMEAFDLALVKPDSTDQDEEDGEEDFVDDTQIQEFVNDVIVSPSYVKTRGSKSAGPSVMDSVVDLDEDSGGGLDDLIPGNICDEFPNYVAAIRNLAMAFSDCCDADGGTSAKIKKISQD